MNTPALNLFIIGPSGCGKSTQAKLIADKYNLIHLSMGQLLRDQIAAKSLLGLQAQKFVNAGKWAPDELVLKILIDTLDKKINNHNFIIDGFPRLLNQGQQIQKHLDKNHQGFSLLIFLDVTFAEINARRAKMGQDFQSKDRSDSTPEAVAARQLSYNSTIKPILAYYQQQNKFFAVDGNRPVEPIFTNICQKIDSLLISQKS